MTRRFAPNDEAWFLQVARRVIEGDTLYRDVYFNTTPLSMYVSVLALSVTGVQLLTIRLVVAASTFGSIVVAGKTVDLAVGSRERAPLLLFGLVLAFRAYPSDAPYTPLAVFFFMLTLYGFVAWNGDGSVRTACWSGVAAGLCFASKHNAGLLAMAALVGGLWLVSRARPTPFATFARTAGASVAGFLVVCVPTLLAIAATGGLEAFIEYGFVNKRTYVAVGSAGYFRQVGRLVALLAEPLTKSSAAELVLSGVLALPPVAMLLTWLCHRRGDHERKAFAAALGVFLLAGCSVAFPRAGSSLLYLVPVLGTIAVIAWRLGGAPRSRRIRIGVVAAASVWIVAAIVGFLTLPVMRIASPDWQFSGSEYWRGILVSSAEEGTWRRNATELRAAIPDREAFLLTMPAGFHYLASGIRNPTPYDLPARSTFGPRGEQKVIDAIESGRVRRVVLFDQPELPEQVPRKLVQFVTRMMIPRARGDGFTVYERRPD